MPPILQQPDRLRRAKPNQKSTTRMLVAKEPAKKETPSLVRHSLMYDAVPRYVSDDPNPAKLAALLKRVDQGELADLSLLQQEMARKSDHFFGVVQTRRNAFLGLEWSIDPDPRADEEDTLAKETADYCSDKLSEIDAFDESVLPHLAEAIGPNLSVVEVVWDKAEVVDFVTVPCTRLASHPITNTGVVVRTDNEPMGLPTEMFGSKFIVHVPSPGGGFPFRATLTHASVLSWLMLHFSRQDWLAFSELYGTPMRIGTYTDPLIDDDRGTLKQMLEQMGPDVAAFFPKGAEIEFKQAQGTGETYQKQCDYADAKLSIAWLGQTLTTDVGDSGSRALGDGHDKVRGDLRNGDMRSEANTIRRQLLRPMVALRFGPDAPVPVFARKVPEKVDIEGGRLTLDRLDRAEKFGLTVSSDWLYESLDIPRPEMELPDTIKLGESTKNDADDPVVDPKTKDKIDKEAT